MRHTGTAIEAVRLPPTAPGVTTQTDAHSAANTFYQLSGGPTAQSGVRLRPALEAVRRGFTAGMSGDASFSLPHQLTTQASFNGGQDQPVRAP